MRIMVVSDLVRANGAGVMALFAARELASAGHTVSLVAGSLDPALEGSLGDVGITTALFTPDARSLDKGVTASEHRSFLRAFRRWFDQTRAEIAPDLVYVHNCGRVFTQLELAQLSQSVPVVHTMHDEWFFTDAHYTFQSSTGETIRTFEPSTGEDVIEHRYEHLFDVPAACDRFSAIGPSSWITERARQVFPTLDVVHINNAVDTDHFCLQSRDDARTSLGLPIDVPIVGFVGNPGHARKGFRKLELALRSLERNGGRPLLLAAGGGGSVATNGARDLVEPGPLRTLVDHPTNMPVGDLGIAGPAIVASGVDRAFMPQVYGAVDVLVHPSKIDNLPTVPIEAGLCGTRCLASDVGGTEETIADAADLFDPDITPDALGGRISEALTDAGREDVTQRQSRRDAQLDRFGVESHLVALTSVFERLVSGGAGL